jgi:hypothetical protein
MRRHASHIVSDGDTPADRVPPGRAVLSMPRALLLVAIHRNGMTKA